MRATRLLAVMLTAALGVSGCSMFSQSDRQSSGSEPNALGTVQEAFATAQTEPSANLGEGAQASVEPAPINQAQNSLPSDFELTQFYDFSIVEGEIPAEGAVLQFTLDEPVMEGQMATIARWDPQQEVWEPLGTTMSSDGLNLSATTPHFSEYGVVLTWVEKLDLQKRLLFGDAAQPPSCKGDPLTGAEPNWSEMLYFEDKLSPTLWCVTGVEQAPDHVVVRLVWSRGTAARITTAIKPLSVTTDLLGEDPSTVVLANASSLDVAINNSGKDFVVQPLGEYSFKFDRDALNDLYLRSPENPLIDVTTGMGYVAIGLAYEQLVDIAGPVPAGVLVLASSGACKELVTSRGDASSSVNAAVECLGSGIDAMTAGQKLIDAGRISANTKLTELGSIANQGAKKLKSLLGFFRIAQTVQALGSALADSQLDEITRRMTYSPSSSEINTLVTAKMTTDLEQCEDFGSSIPYNSGYDMGAGCQVLDPVTFNHPAYGQVDFVLGTQIVNSTPNLTYWLVSGDGQVLSRRSSEGDAGRQLEAPKLDGSGNIIYTYNPGRSDGCVALRPKSDWFEGFGTDPMQVPGETPDYGTRFYGCQWTDEDDDGEKEILYMPSGGADDVYQPESFRWNGEDYVSNGYRPLPDGSWLPGY